jgi:hypothetical protein
MNILPTLTQLEQDIALKNELVFTALESTHCFAETLSAINGKFWGLPTERLLAMLNADINVTIATFQANTALGVAINAPLDAIGHPQFTRRAPVEPGRTDIVFDGEKFVYVAPPPLPPPSQPE